MECNGWCGGKIGGARRGLGGEELVIACVDNFLAKFDCEGEFGDTEQELEGHAHNGKGFFGCWCCLCVLMGKILERE